MGVNDPEYFAIKLDNIIIGSEKMMVNISRFERPSKNMHEPNVPKKKPFPAYHVASRHKPVSTTTYHRPLLSRPQSHTKDKPCTSKSFDQPEPSNPKHPDKENHPHPPKTLTHSNDKPASSNTSAHLESPNPKNLVKSRVQWNSERPLRSVKYIPPPRPKKPWAHRSFMVDESAITNLEKAYVGVVDKPGMSYRI